MEKFLLSLLCLLTVGFAGQAETITFGNGLPSDWTKTGNTANQTRVSKKCLQLQKGASISTPQLANVTEISVELNISSNATTLTIAQSLDGTNWNTLKTINKSDCSTSEWKSFTVTPEGDTSNGIFFKLTSAAASYYISEFTYTTSTVSFPTDCAVPVFTIDGVEAAGENLTAYAGSKIAVSCATKDSKTVWSVAKGNDEIGTNIEGTEYVISADAQIGDTYTFAATSSVQGETELLTKSNTITLTIVKAPLRFTFDFVNNTYELGERDNNKEYQATNKDFTEAISGIRVQTSDKNMRLWSDGLRCYNESSISFTAPFGYMFSSTSFDSTGNSSFSASLSDDNKTYTIKYTPSSNNKAIKTVTLEWVELPAVPELASGDFSLTENELKTEGKTLRINFTKVEGLDIYYSLKADATAVTPDEGEGGKVTRAEGEGHTHDAAFQLHDGNEIELNNTHTQLSYFACDPTTGMHSETKTLALTIGATGVAEIEAAEAGEVRWFDMQGREVKGQPAAGVYVRVANGKAAKVIVK